MKDTLEAINEGFDLLARRSDGARLVIECRSDDKYRIEVEPRGSLFVANIERVSQEWMLSTQIALGEHLATITAADLEELSNRLRAQLLNIAGPAPLTTRAFYSISKFADRRFSDGREEQERIQLKRRSCDLELMDFMRSTVRTALDWQPLTGDGQFVSLRCYPEEGKCAAVYVDVRQSRRGYEIEIEDRVQYPWKEVTLSASTAADVEERVAGYMSQNHRFALTGMHVSYFYTAHEERIDKALVKRMDDAYLMSRLPRRRGLFATLFGL